MSLTQNRTATALAFAVQAFLFLTLSTRLNDMRDTWGISNEALSGLLLMMVLLAGVGSILTEQMAKRRDSATGLRVGLLLVGAGAAVVLMSDSLGTAVPGLVVYGLGLGMVDAATNMQAVALEHRYGRPILPSFHGAWTLGAILGALLTVISGDWSDSAIACFALLPVLASFLPYLPGDNSVPSTQVQGLPTRPLLLVGLALTLFYTVDVAVQTWGGTYAHDVFEMSKDTAAWAVLAYLVASGCVRLAGDRLVTRFGPRPVIRVGGVVGAVGLLVIVVAPSWPLALVGYAVAGAGLAVVAPLAFSTAARLARDSTDDPAVAQQRADAAIARFNLFNYAGALLGSVATGLVGGSDLRYGFVLPAVLALALVPLARHFRTATPAGVPQSAA